MSNRVQWNPSYSMGNEIIDNQHRNILAQCNALADCVIDTGPEDDLEFREIFNQLMALAREHFSSEESVLVRCAYPMLEEHQNERD